MPTQSELENAFQVYFDEIQRCIDCKCYWALLHLVTVLPDICGAIESDDGEASGPHYKDWCSRYLADTMMSSEDWYGIRCVVLHQGRTLANRGQYAAYSFSQPNARGSVVHRNVTDNGNARQLHLDVVELAREVVAGIRRWFGDVQANTHPSRSSNVARNLPSLARGHVSRGGPIRVEMTIHQTLTTSSPWPANST